jgi:GNAT superfamily N-acetyltransferase
MLDSPEYVLVTHPADIDTQAVHAFLTEAYWSRGIPLAVVERAIQNSLCFGFKFQGQQVAFARVITDRATFGYLADVYVLESHRGQGLSKRLMQAIQAHPELQNLRRQMLATRDAHGLYSGFGYKPVATPERLMEIFVPNIYSEA